jgi:UDP-N-acetyl-D-mannosaminuronic acid transferase (WecB/TagA/CpsF family)
MRVLEAKESGHGILVEHDGYISPDENKAIISEMKDNPV